MSAGFTPGPWWGGVISNGQPIAQDILDEFAQSRGGTLGAIADGSDRFLAFVASTQETLAEDRANANLIAAAPELYEAARLAMEYDALLRTYKGPFKVLCDGDDVLLDEAYDRWITASKAALAKARGEQVPE